MNAYERVTLLDGTHVFKDTASRLAQREVAKILARVWKCRVEEFPALCKVDWWAARDFRMAALLELKCRKANHDKYDTVYLALAKWFALKDGAASLSTCSMFVVRFTDGIWFIPIKDVDTSDVIIAGRNDRGREEYEPVILVKIASMTKLDEEGANAP
jgi:hypothetical protein